MIAPTMSRKSVVRPLFGAIPVRIQAERLLYMMFRVPSMGSTIIKKLASDSEAPSGKTCQPASSMPSEISANGPISIGPLGAEMVENLIGVGVDAVDRVSAADVGDIGERGAGSLFLLRAEVGEEVVAHLDMERAHLLDVVFGRPG